MITVITPTADQPRGISLLEQYMARQTVQPRQWIVADDGEVPATLTRGQTHLISKREYEGAKSLASNLLRGLEAAKGDIILIMEHDDWYRADHIKTCVEQLEGADATGSIWQRYYNVQNRHWRVMRNVGSALCNTAFRSSLIPAMQKAAEQAFNEDKIGLDRLFWDSIDGRTHEINTMVGIKGLPGRTGLGLGHKPPDNQWTADPDHKVLREWVGDDVSNYQ